MGLNWFMPALANSSVGSSCGTTGEEGTSTCCLVLTKKSMKVWRMRVAGQPLTSTTVPAAARRGRHRLGPRGVENHRLLALGHDADGVDELRGGVHGLDPLENRGEGLPVGGGVQSRVDGLEGARADDVGEGGGVAGEVGEDPSVASRVFRKPATVVLAAASALGSWVIPRSAPIPAMG